MPLQLMISERRPELLAIWRKVFRGIQGVTLLETDAPTLMKRPGVDAELMMSTFAHERYGGQPEYGESQVLSTQQEPNMPPWVVTTAPLPAYSEYKVWPNGTLETVAVRDQELTPEEETYIVFIKAFDRIKQFNKSAAEPKIKILGFDLKFLNFPQGDPRKEAEAVRRAYLEQYGEVPMR